MVRMSIRLTLSVRLNLGRTLFFYGVGLRPHPPIISQRTSIPRNQSKRTSEVPIPDRLAESPVVLSSTSARDRSRPLFKNS